MGIEIKTSTNFSKTKKHLSHLSRLSIASKLKPYAERGVYELAKATPINTGNTARSWYYKIEADKDGMTIKFLNDYAPYGVSVAVLIQNGHATRSGSYVEGIDYINPALKPVFDDILKSIQKEVREN